MTSSSIYIWPGTQRVDSEKSTGMTAFRRNPNLCARKRRSRPSGSVIVKRRWRTSATPPIPIYLRWHGGNRVCQWGWWGESWSVHMSNLSIFFCLQRTCSSNLCKCILVNLKMVTEFLKETLTNIIELFSLCLQFC